MIFDFFFSYNFKVRERRSSHNKRKMKKGNIPYSRQLEGVSNQIEWLIAWGGTIRKRVSGGGAPISRSSQRRGPITLERGHKCGR